MQENNRQANQQKLLLPGIHQQTAIQINESAKTVPTNTNEYNTNNNQNNILIQSQGTGYSKYNLKQRQKFFTNRDESFCSTVQNISQMLEQRQTMSCKTLQSSFKTLDESKSVPISNLTVTKYKFLINQSKTDAILLPVLPPKYKNQSSGNLIAEVKNQSNQAQNKKTAIDKDLRGFISFEDVKKNNKSMLIEIGEQNPDLQKTLNIDVNTQRYGKNIALYQGMSEQSDPLKKKEFKYIMKSPLQIQLELTHNKDMQYQINQTVKENQKQKTYELQELLQTNEKKIRRMPTIKSYPAMRGGVKIGSQGNDGEASEQNKQKEQEENQEKEKRMKQYFFSEKQTYNIFWYTFDQFFWKPDMREGSTLIVDQNYGYLFGGIGNKVFNDLQIISLNSFKWKIEPGCKGNPPPPRYGHSACYYKRNIVIFGGEKKYNYVMKMRECVLDAYFFHIDSLTWKPLNCTNVLLQPRRNHAAAVVGKSLIIHGGFNSKDVIMQDIWILDLQSYTWQEAFVQPNEKHQAGFHACCGVYYPQRHNNYNLYKKNDIVIPKWSPQIKVEGIYYFGGKNNDGHIHENLRILKTDTNPFIWIKPETTGIPPPPRYSHSMCYHESLNFLIIHGGLNDTLDYNYLSDTYLLNIENLNWIKLVQFGIQPISRANHCVGLFDSKMVIFGGLNLQGYVGSSISLVELDHNLATTMRDKGSLFAPDSSRKCDSRDNQNKDGNKNKTQTIDSIPIKNVHDTKENQEKKVKSKEQEMIDKLTYGNFKSFLPLPQNTTILRPQGRQNTATKIKDLWEDLINKNNTPANNQVQDNQQQPQDNQINQVKDLKSPLSSTSSQQSPMRLVEKTTLQPIREAQQSPKKLQSNDKTLPQINKKRDKSPNKNEESEISNNSFNFNQPILIKQELSTSSPISNNNYTSDKQ